MPSYNFTDKNPDEADIIQIMEQNDEIILSHKLSEQTLKSIAQRAQRKHKITIPGDFTIQKKLRLVLENLPQVGVTVQLLRGVEALTTKISAIVPILGNKNKLMFGFQQSRPFNTIKRLSRLTPGVIFSPIIENSDQAIIIAKNLPSGVTLSLDQTEPDPIVAAIADHILSGQTIICNNKPIYDQINAIRLMRRLLANGEFDINLIQSPQGAASSAGAGISASSSSQAGAADERTPVQLSADKVLELKGKDTTHQAIVSGMKNFDIVTISHSLTQAALAQIGQQTQGKHTLMLSPGIKKSQLEQIVTNLTPSNPTLWFHEFKGNSQWTLFEHNDFEHNDLEYIFALLTNVTIKLDCDHHKGKDLNSLLQRLKNENNITFAPIVSKASQAKIIGENLPNKVKLKLERGEISLEAAKSIAMNIGSDHAIICDEAQIFTAMRDILNSRTTDDPAFTFHITSIKNSSNPEASSRAQSPFFNPSKKTRLGASEEREDDEDTTKQASPMSHA